MPKITNNKISNLLSGDHARIESLLDTFSKHNIANNSKLVNVSFKVLRSELEKHFKIEEVAIFKFIDSADQESFAFVPLLIKQHDQICEQLRDIKNKLSTNSKINIHKFRSLLNDHKILEDSKFYPKLDKALSQGQKDLMIKKLREKFNKEYQL